MISRNRYLILHNEILRMIIQSYTIAMLSVVPAKLIDTYKPYELRTPKHFTCIPMASALCINFVPVQFAPLIVHMYANDPLRRIDHRLLHCIAAPGFCEASSLFSKCIYRRIPSMQGNNGPGLLVSVFLFKGSRVLTVVDQSSE